MPAFTKECKQCYHMNHFNSQKWKQCHAQLAIGGKPTAKKGKKCKVCESITVGHVNTPHCWLLLKKITVKKYCGYPSVADLQFDKGGLYACVPTFWGDSRGSPAHFLIEVNEMQVVQDL